MINVNMITDELNWLQVLLDRRNRINSGQETNQNVFEAEPPVITPDGSAYAELIQKYGFNAEERLALILALSVHLDPRLLDIFKQDKTPTSFGGIIGKNHRGFIPSGETLMFIIAGHNLKERLKLMNLFSKEHIFYKDNLLYLEQPLASEPELSGILTASADLIDTVISGKPRKPDLRPDFPAKLLSTEMTWRDIVLPAATMYQLNEIETWISYQACLKEDKNIGKKIKPGFRALFYGPPGTGKTMSASLLGKKTGRDVYRVDLSTIVSKYIGETEKNLARLFDRAERKDWILFFDEADALFGKRTNVSDSHDRYANQEVSYLLQRIEYHEGLVILATNMKNNMDGAFLRRFQSIVYFPMPKTEERLKIWNGAFSDSIPLEKGNTLNDIAKRHELSGSLILNIVSHATLKAISEKREFISVRMLEDSIARELAKEGRTL